MLKRHFPHYGEVVREVYNTPFMSRKEAIGGMGKISPRVLSLIAVVAALVAATLIATVRRRKLAPLLPKQSSYSPCCGNHLTATITLHFGQKNGHVLR